MGHLTGLPKLNTIVYRCILYAYMIIYMYVIYIYILYVIDDISCSYTLGCAVHASANSSQQDMAFRSSAELVQRMTRDWEVLRTLHGCSSEELSEQSHFTCFSISLYWCYCNVR